jgi:hypothetical protein
MHEVWAVKPGQKEPSLVQRFTAARWQWAEKLAEFLRDRGYRSVEVRTLEGGG